MLIHVPCVCVYVLVVQLYTLYSSFNRNRSRNSCAELIALRIAVDNGQDLLIQLFIIIIHIICTYRLLPSFPQFSNLFQFSFFFFEIWNWIHKIKSLQNGNYTKVSKTGVTCFVCLYIPLNDIRRKFWMHSHNDHSHFVTVFAGKHSNILVN